MNKKSIIITVSLLYSFICWGQALRIRFFQAFMPILVFAGQVMIFIW